jgi:hypothetical protein
MNIMAIIMESNVWNIHWNPLESCSDPKKTDNQICGSPGCVAVMSPCRFSLRDLYEQSGSEISWAKDVHEVIVEEGGQISSGKRLHNYGKSPFLMG